MRETSPVSYKKLKKPQRLKKSVVLTHKLIDINGKARNILQCMTNVLSHIKEEK